MTPDGLQESYQMEFGGVQHAVYVRGNGMADPIIEEVSAVNQGSLFTLGKV